MERKSQLGKNIDQLPLPSPRRTSNSSRSMILCRSTFWLLRRLCAIITYLVRLCFCFRKTSKVKPEENDDGHGFKQISGPRHEEGDIETETEHTPDEDEEEEEKPVVVNVKLLTNGHGDDLRIQYSLPASKVGTPRQSANASPRHHVVELEPTNEVLGRMWYSCDLKKDSGDHLRVNRKSDKVKTSSKDGKTLVINEHLTQAELKSYLDHSLSFKLLTIEFDLRQFPPDVTSDSVFEILQQAFLHPNVQEFRIRIDNWRNHIHQQENIIPTDDSLGHSIRTDYPMKLSTLIIYCPGVTLHHLFIYRGFIVSQTNLSTLICNFDAVMWRFYKPILKALSGTLTKLELYSITNYNGDSTNVDPFNWNHIAHLVNLKYLKIWGDARYYGLRHRNLSSWLLNTLTELELKYVDLDIEDLEHLLLHSESLTVINLQFFTPVPGPMGTVLPVVEFIETIGAALSEPNIKNLSLSDHKLPGSIMDRHVTLSGHAAELGFTSIWTTPDNTFDLMTFQRQD